MAVLTTAGTASYKDADSLNAWKLGQEGSPSRDRFKSLHKTQLNRKFFALNSDLELIQKWPIARIIARLDFKTLGDNVTFTEGIAYNHLVALTDIPVYLVEARHSSREFCQLPPEDHRFNIYRYVWADWKPNPPEVEKEVLQKNLIWSEFEGWEDSIRNDAARRYQIKIVRPTP